MSVLKIIVLLTCAVLGAVGTSIGSGERQLVWPPSLHANVASRAFDASDLKSQIKIGGVCLCLNSLDKRVDQQNYEKHEHSEKMPHLYLRGGQTAKSGPFLPIYSLSLSHLTGLSLTMDCFPPLLFNEPTGP